MDSGNNIQSVVVGHDIGHYPWEAQSRLFQEALPLVLLFTPFAIYYLALGLALGLRLLVQSIIFFITLVFYIVPCTARLACIITNLVIKVLRYIAILVSVLLFCLVTLCAALSMSEDSGALLEVWYSGKGVFSPTQVLAEGDTFVRVSFNTSKPLVLSDTQQNNTKMTHYSVLCGEVLLRAWAEA